MVDIFLGSHGTGATGQLDNAGLGIDLKLFSLLNPLSVLGERATFHILRLGVNLRSADEWLRERFNLGRCVFWVGLLMPRVFTF